MMNREKGVSGNKIFLFAFILSFFIHLLSVASLEAAVLLNRVFLSHSKDPYIYFNLVSKYVSNLRVETQKIQVSIPAKKEEVQAEPTEVDEQVPALEKDFLKSQVNINKKVKKIKKQLNSLARKSKPSRESLNSYVSDLEKVPSRARRDLLPAYLKKMKLGIASIWLEQVDRNGIGSGSAVIQYRIDSDGHVSNLKAISKEGSEIFRTACLEAIREASPYGPLPFRFSESLEDQYLTIELAFYLERPKQRSSVVAQV
jgi:outer membrane biosynthesis protein TonB